MRMMTGFVLVLGLSLVTESERPGLLKSGEYREMEEGSLRQSSPPEPAADDVYAVGPYATRAPELPRAEGVDAVEVYCQICHGTSYITMQPPLPPETWAAEVEKMMTTHGAALPEEAAAAILRYLQANFTPETRKKGR